MFYPIFVDAVAAYGGIVAGLFFLQRRLLYHPGSIRPALADLAVLGVREIELTTEDGLTLFSWYLPPRAGRPVIAYFHGNGGHVGYRAERLRRFAREGYGVLLAEYRGYAGNPGLPCEDGLFADGEAALDFLADAGIDPAEIVVWGESLGSGVAVYLAARHKVAAVILEAPYTSVAAAAQRHYPFVPAALLVRDRFDSLSRVGRVTAPLLVLHGERDMVVPARHGRALLAAATAPKEGWFSPEASHENLARFGALEAAIAFIDRRVRPVQPEPVAAAANFD
ncbi:MAG TPA: alpha/beta fold hydrolase [Stellaceae bacterium]|nr:alpha/beta fold hydrolase [Stellaceae bacterium]